MMVQTSTLQCKVTNLELLEKEIEKRQYLFQGMDAIFNELFVLHPSNRMKRILRNKVHVAIAKPLGLKQQWAPTRRLINEYLLSRGVEPILISGRLYFARLEFRHGQ